MTSGKAEIFGTESADKPIQTDEKCQSSELEPLRSNTTSSNKYVFGKLGTKLVDMKEGRKSGSKICEFEEDVTKVRRIFQRGIIFEFSTNSNHTEDFRGAIGELLFSQLY